MNQEGSGTPKMPCDTCPELMGEGFCRKYRVFLRDESSKESHSKQCGKWYKDGLK